MLKNFDFKFNKLESFNEKNVMKFIFQNCFFFKYFYRHLENPNIGQYFEWVSDIPINFFCLAFSFQSMQINLKFAHKVKVPSRTGCP